MATITIKQRLKKAGIKLVKKPDEAYLEYKGMAIPLPKANNLICVCKLQFGLSI